MINLLHNYLTISLFLTLVLYVVYFKCRVFDFHPSTKLTIQSYQRFKISIAKLINIIINYNVCGQSNETKSGVDTLVTAISQVDELKPLLVYCLLLVSHSISGTLYVAF